MTSNAETGRPSGKRGVGVFGRVSSLWLRLLLLSALTAGVAAAIASVVSAMLDGGLASLSTAAGALLVMVFFAISLLIGHFVGRNNPSGAIGLFVATYFIKVVGFAIVLFALGRPDWLNGRWFLIGAVVGIVAWQAAELYGFSKARLQIFNDPADRKAGPDATA
ncbi:hypothetical protein [Paenarthrobacter sp. NPDC058040]|uniref:hypothetical protein n=1 Tax=unclassified Paenarthrobacter TaxID=2634190 RepID=UPI0036DD736E